MRFRKKPVVIEAEQFWPNRRPWPAGVVEVDPDCHPDGRHASDCGFAVDTLEGRALNVTPGDWIITGVKGERYPCKPDIFAATYEPAE